MRRTIVALGVAGVLVLAGCGGTAPSTSDAAADALQQVGFQTESTGKPSVKAVRKHLRKNTLHGEVVVQTKKNGAQTVVVQRGSVTAVASGSVSVKSSDGFALTWKLGDKLRVVQDRKTAELSAVKTGAEIGIAGVRDGNDSTARIIVLE